jgi:hypothetical protein
MFVPVDEGSRCQAEQKRRRERPGAKTVAAAKQKVYRQQTKVKANKTAQHADA